MRLGLSAGITSIVLLTAACSDDPTGTALPVQPAVVETPSSVTKFLDRVKDVPAVAFQRPPNTRSSNANPEVLASRIQAAGGMAVLGLKAPQAPRWSSSGQRGAISKADIVDGLAFLDSLGVTVVAYLENFGMAQVRIDPDLVAVVAESPFVDYIEPDDVIPQALAAIGRSAAPLPAQTTPWGISKIGANSAWQKTSGGGSVRVMIIDNGHEQGHEDLPSVPSANCAGPYAGCSVGIGNVAWHGTHVLGILTARSNGLGVVGVAKGVSSSNVYVYAACDANGGCTAGNIASGINQAVTWGIDVLSMSVGVDHTTGLQNAVSQASSADIVMIAAAGNHCHRTEGGCPPNAVRYPAGYGQVMGVSGTHTDDTFAHHNNLPSQCLIDFAFGADAWNVSNSGPHVDVSAPFHALSTYPDDEYETECGTSMATPHVAGVAAMIRAFMPTLADYQVRQRITNTAVDLGPEGWDDEYGYGRVSAYNALGPWASINGPQAVPPGQSCEWSGNASGGNGSVSLQWYKDQAPVGTGTSVTLSASSSFELELVATDGDGFWGRKSLWVQVSSQAQECPW